MPKKVTDITPKPELPQTQENLTQPEAMPQPEGVEVAPQMPAEQIPQMPTEGQVEPEKIEPSTAPLPTQVTPPQPAKSQVLEKIEDILEEDLEQIYFQMPPNKQAEFNKVGEETATKISVIMQGAKIQVKKILELIIRWLKIIPGINKYFLEQEAKIKTDELMKLKSEQGQQQQGPSDQNRI